MDDFFDILRDKKHIELINLSNSQCQPCLIAIVYHDSPNHVRNISKFNIKYLQSSFRFFHEPPIALYQKQKEALDNLLTDARLQLLKDLWRKILGEDLVEIIDNRLAKFEVEVFEVLEGESFLFDGVKVSLKKLGNCQSFQISEPVNQLLQIEVNDDLILC